MKRIISLLFPSIAFGQYDVNYVTGLLDFTDSTPLNLGDDRSVLTNIGFDFTFDNQTFTQVYVSSNGFLSFTDGNHLCCNGNPINSPNTPIGIYGVWTDLISSVNPYIKKTDDAFIATWIGTNEYGTGKQFTFQIALTNRDTFSILYGGMPNLRYHVATGGYKGFTNSYEIFFGQDIAQYGYTGYEFGMEVEEEFTPIDLSFLPDVVPDVSGQVEEEVSDEIEEVVEEVIEEVVEEVSDEVYDEVTDELTSEVSSEVAEEVEKQEIARDTEELLDPFSFIQSDEYAQDITEYTQEEQIYSEEITVNEIEQIGSFEQLTSQSPIEIVNVAQADNFFSPESQIMMMGAIAETPQPAQEQSESKESAADEIGQVDVSEYKQSKLPAQPQFYKSETPYKKQLQDNNLMMYRMSNDSVWNKLRDSQYER